MGILEIAKLLFDATRLQSDFYAILDGFLPCEDSTVTRRYLDDRSRSHRNGLV